MTTEIKPLEGDGLTVTRCEGCSGLRLVMLSKGKPIAYVCPPDMALLELSKLIVDEVCNLAEEKAQAKKTMIHLQ